MVQPIDILEETPSQTAGPYVHIGCTPNFVGIHTAWPEDLGRSPVTGAARGERITVTGQVIDGTGTPLRDAMLESWQADAAGLYPGQPGADPGVTGWCRFAGDHETGDWRLETIKPGPVPHPQGMQAPHLSLWIVARGINTGLQTRMYFEDEDNEADPLLRRIEHRLRVPTLIARKTGTGTYRFDIRLQGENETIFLDI